MKICISLKSGGKRFYIRVYCSDVKIN